MGEISSEKIKEALNNHRLTKNLLWNSLIVITGGIIGLFFRIINGNLGFLELILLLSGFILLFLFMKFLGETNYYIDKYWKQLK